MALTLDILAYHEWYNHPENDAYQGEYGPIFRLFGTTSPAETPAALTQQVAVDIDMKFAFVQLDPAGEVRVLHRVRTLQPKAGFLDPQDNIHVGILGDVFRSGVNFVELPANAFRRLVALEIATPATISTLLADHPEALQVAHPVTAVATDHSVVRTRYLMLIPPMLVGKILYATTTPGGLNPRVLWTEIASPLYDDDLYRTDCAPFIDWCRVAFAGGVKADNPLNTKRPPTLELGDRLDRERFAMLRQDLPCRFDPASPAPFLNFGPPPLVAAAQMGQAAQMDPAAQMAPIVAVLENFTHAYTVRADAADAREIVAAAREEARRDRPPAVTSIQERWMESLPDLLVLCQVAAVDQLPPLWSAMARHGLKADRRTIQNFVNRKDALFGPSGFSNLQINISVELATDIGHLRFAAEKADYIGAGLSIFMVSYPTVESVAYLRRSVELYDSQMDSAQALTLTEAKEVRTQQKFALPTSYVAVKQVCRAYHRLLAATLGFNHAITQAYTPFLRHLEEEELMLTDFLGRDVHKCAGILRYVQIAVHYCFQAVQNGRGAPLPDFMGVFPEIQRGTWIPPPIPGINNRPAAAPAADRNQAPAPAAGVIYVHAPPGYIDRAVIPIIPNFNPKACIAARGPPPLNDKGNPMCLRYQVIGLCVADCARVPDHKKHCSAENTRLATYLNKTKP